MTEQQMAGARRIVQLTVDVLEALSDDPKQVSDLQDNVSVDVSRQTLYRVLDQLSENDSVKKVNADGEVDENGRSWIVNND
jgi:Fe2+ or Zn2+ uptake regulation protein